MKDKNKRPVGQMHLVVWSDQSVSVTWSTFLRGESLDGYSTGQFRPEDIGGVVDNVISDITDTIRRDEED
jgi:hypothetical protein